jgi:hypothetical protein
VGLPRRERQRDRDRETESMSMCDPRYFIIL